MSQENVKLFYQALATDESLKAKLKALAEQRQSKAGSEAPPEAIFQMASAAGFDFTLEDLKAYSAQALKLKPDEVPDEELASVVGGVAALYANVDLGDIWTPEVRT